MMDVFQALRNRDWGGIALAHVMGWFGEGNPMKVHRNSGYKSNDPGVVSKQCELMQSVGIQGVIMTTMGEPVNPFLHQSTLLMLAECEKRGMWFSVLLDPWMAKGQKNPTQAVIDQLKSADFQKMFASPRYLREKYVLDFDLLGSAGVNVATVQAAVPTLQILSKHVGFSWPEIANSLAVLKRDNGNPAMKIPGVGAGFNDAGMPLPPHATVANYTGARDYSQSVWSEGLKNAKGELLQPARVLDGNAGNTWMDEVAVTPLLTYAALVTWNDYDEGTAFEQFVAIMKGIRLA